MTRRRIRNEHGFALAAVTSLIGPGSVRAREASLVMLRAYRAAQGHGSCVVSRARQWPPCGDDCKNFAGRRTAMDNRFQAATTDHRLIAETWPVRRDIRAPICCGVAVMGSSRPANRTDLIDTRSFTHLARVEPL